MLWVRDNEGNYALSEIQHTSVNTVDEFSQQPVIGSLFPTTTGRVDYVTVVQSDEEPRRLWYLHPDNRI